MGKRGSGSSGGIGGGGGGGNKQDNPYTEHNGVKTYHADEAGAKAFSKLSGNVVHWNKGAYIAKEGDSIGVQIKRREMWDYLKRRDINDFVVTIEKGREKQALKQLSDYGYNVKAKSGFNEQAKSVSSEVQYYVGKKEIQYQDLHFKTQTYYKKGWKG